MGRPTRVELWIDPRDDPPRELTSRQAAAMRLPEGAQVKVEHLWFVVHLQGGWRAAYRLIPRDGRPVVAELRVYPLLGDLPDLNPGEWAVELRGFAALEHVPNDGVTAGLIKDQVIPGEHIYDLLPRFLERHTLRSMFEPWLRGLGYDPGRKPHVPRRGPKGWPDREYAELPSFYLERCNAESRSPVKDTAERYGMKPSAFRAALSRARNRGLLVRTTRGRAGGRLTSRAQNLLREPRRL